MMHPDGLGSITIFVGSNVLKIKTVIGGFVVSCKRRFCLFFVFLFFCFFVFVFVFVLSLLWEVPGVAIEKHPSIF